RKYRCLELRFSSSLVKTKYLLNGLGSSLGLLFSTLAQFRSDCELKGVYVITLCNTIKNKRIKLNFLFSSNLLLLQAKPAESKKSKKEKAPAADADSDEDEVLEEIIEGDSDIESDEYDIPYDGEEEDLECDDDDDDNDDGSGSDDQA
ncbi:PREDICTED: 46 kDa FK506-binding nuclear protein-like, partial [Rhagoletis zephyria]|uniref:46 kDa FK506-binding nuclear protein-like n=1 Tax=Rhagoletis zephyria TaxID=28612 RepID=UPI00081146AD